MKHLTNPFGAIVDPMKKFEKMNTKRADGTDDTLTAMQHQMKQNGTNDGDPGKRNGPNNFIYQTAANLEMTGAGQHATISG